MADYEVVQQSFMSGITNIYDHMEELRDFCAGCGWTIYDDQTSATDRYFVIKSSDTALEDNERPCYVGFKVFSSNQYYLRVMMFLNYDNVTHTAKGIRRWNNSYDYWADVQTYRDYYTLHCVKFNASGVNNLTLYGNKYYINLLLHRDSDVTYVGAHIFKFMDNPYDYKFKILNDVDKGKHKVIQLEDNQAQKLEVGDSLWLLCKDNDTFSKINVKSVNTVDDNIIADEVYWATVSGSLLGSTMQLLPWAIKIDSNESSTYARAYYYQTFMCFNNGVVDTYYKDNSYYSGSLSSSAYYFPTSTATSSLYSVGCRPAMNDLLYGQPNEMFGYNDYIKAGAGSNRDTVGYNLHYSGTATSGTSDTLIDLSRSWETNELESKCIITTDGMSAGDVLSILSNTSDMVTISGSFTYTPDTSTEYGIYDAGYIKVGNNLYGSSYSYLLRIA